MNYKHLRTARWIFLTGFIGFTVASMVIFIVIPSTSSITGLLYLVSLTCMMSYFITVQAETKALEHARHQAVDAAIVTGEGKFVFIRQGTDPLQWTLPGGLRKENETPEAACLRLAKEATGLDLEVIRTLPYYLDLERDPAGTVISTPLLCEVAGGALQAGSSVTAIALFRKREIRKFRLPLGRRKLIQRCALFSGDKFWLLKVAKKNTRQRKGEL